MSCRSEREELAFHLSSRSPAHPCVPESEGCAAEAFLDLFQQAGEISCLPVGGEGLQYRLLVQWGQTVISLEKGRYDPSLPLAFRLAAVFGRRIEELFIPDTDPRL